MKKHIFIVGSKGIPGAYGGYETFVDRLTQYHQDKEEIQYYVACKGREAKKFRYHNANCFTIKVPNIGPAQAIYYDMVALNYCCRYIKKNKINEPIVYILACRIGPFAGWFQRRIHKLGGKLYVNPDGHEWMRGKWSKPVREYWKISENMMVKHADMLICDSKNIEKYIQEEYAKYKPETTFIAYGAETSASELSDEDRQVTEWYKEKAVRPNEYYLVVGRFVPENNYETMIREFVKSDTEKDFVLITDIDNHQFLDKLKAETGFDQDSRIKFVGTVYNQELLKKIRENAYGYFHGHEVGGTNPSLLEALGSTKLNLLLDVGFNREVAEDSAIYWTKDSGSLAELIHEVDRMSEEEISRLKYAARKRITDWYNWGYIAEAYEAVFTEKGR